MNRIEFASGLFKEYPDVVGVSELQKMIGISQSKAYELLQSHAIKAIKIGKDYKIPKINIALYILGEEQLWKEH